MSQPQVKLERSLSLTLITLYGVGTILGAGIYVLVGKVAGLSGIYAPIAFLVAAVIALFSGLSYAELSALYPKSSGEAIYVQEAFKRNWLSQLVGWLVVLTGIVSAATLANGFVGYLHIFIKVPPWLVITIVIIAMGFLAGVGISESVGVAAIITLIEIAGLILVIWVSYDHITTLPDRWQEFDPPFEIVSWIGILLGAFLAFYAFIGFEDMVNVAEEVKDPCRNLPLSIIIAIIVTTIFYIVVALATVASLPLDELVVSDAPLALVVERNSTLSPYMISLISLLAVINGALIQIIMASRVMYGMGQQKLAPSWLGKVNPMTRTPIIATLIVTAIVLLLALWFPLTTLARATSFIILTIFILVNLSLILLKLQKVNLEQGPEFSLIIPIIGATLCMALLGFQLVNVLF